MIRLHRRATSRFRNRDDRPEVLSIWLSYAKTQASLGLQADARLTLRHLHNQHMGERDSRYYLTTAELEEQWGETEAAMTTLQLGLQKKAQPSQELVRALEILQQKRSITGMTLNSKRMLPQQEVSPKRRKTETGIVNVEHSTTSDKRLFPTQNSLPEAKINPAEVQDHAGCTFARPGMQCSPSVLRETTSDETTARAGKMSMSPSPSIHLRDQHEEAQSSLKFSERTPLRTTFQLGSRNGSSVLSSSKRPPLLSKVPGTLSRRSKLGLPQRVDPSNCSMDADSDSDNDTTNKATVESCSENPILSPSLKLSKKFTKAALSYIFDWCPAEKPGGNTDEDPTDSTERQVDNAAKSSKPAMLSKIDEASSQTDAAAQATIKTLSESCNGAVSPTAVKGNNNQTGDKHNDSHEHPITRHSLGATQPETNSLVARANPDFLRLVCEENMLHVNGQAYAKLGVIGRGGSCKVYRALSKECAVVAVKKVKLAGMRKKAIDAFANEIALLKKLQGNPAIIQMFDSEVDLKRKSIFVVMELGEVDLNHVLHQQTLTARGSSNGLRRNLNMNFIRLTWQQMLSAVYSIHEARIIHGDLKPANFLFVRGALKLIDFGIAKAMQNEHTTNIYRDTQIGTVNYMSPESFDLDALGGADGGVKLKMGRVSTKGIN